MTIDLHLNAIQFTQCQYAAGYQTDRHDEISVQALPQAGTVNMLQGGHKLPEG